MILLNRITGPSPCQMFEGIIDAELLAGNFEIKIKVKNSHEYDVLLHVISKYQMNEWHTSVSSVQFPNAVATIRFSK